MFWASVTGNKNKQELSEEERHEDSPVKPCPPECCLCHMWIQWFCTCFSYDCKQLLNVMDMPKSLHPILRHHVSHLNLWSCNMWSSVQWHTFTSTQNQIVFCTLWHPPSGCKHDCVFLKQIQSFKAPSRNLFNADWTEISCLDIMSCASESWETVENAQAHPAASKPELPTPKAKTQEANQKPNGWKRYVNRSEQTQSH